MCIIDSSQTDNRLNWTLTSMHDDTRWAQVIGRKAVLSKRQKVKKNNNVKCVEWGREEGKIQRKATTWHKHRNKTKRIA